MSDPVVIGQIDESFHQVGGGIMHETLLRLGHQVTVREGPHPQIYPLLGDGEVHLFATSWLPGGHSLYWEDVQDRARPVSPLYDGARFFWAVPEYIPADMVSSLEDLARADVVRRMATLVVQGTTAGAGLTARSRQVVSAYGLDRLGWRYQVGDLRAIIRTIEEGVAAGDWFITPLWQPQYLNRVHRLRPLEDPLGIFPPPDQAWLTANRAAFDRLPERTRAVLQRIRVGIDDITAMDHAVNVDRVGTLQAAQAWMLRHRDQVRAWLD
jgi:glycine betaine/proline transport system substrate-binding protein